MATRRRVSRKNIVNTISDTERRLAYVEKLPTKTTLADGSVTTAKLATASITKQKVVFGTVNPIADIPGAGSVTEQDKNSMYFDSGTGSLVGVDDNGDQIPVIDSAAQAAAAGAVSTSNNALASANGKNKVFHQGTAPTNAELAVGELETGDLWFDTSQNYRMAKYNKTTTSWGQFELGYLAISAIDAGKITAGSLVGRTILLNGGSSSTVLRRIKTKKITYNTVILETPEDPTGFSASDTIVVSGLGSPYDGEFPVLYVVDDAVAYGISGAVSDVAKVNAFKDITQKQIVSEVATLTTSTNHGFAVGNSVIVESVGSPFNSPLNSGVYESFNITAVTSNTFSYKIPGASPVSSTAVSPSGKVYATVKSTSYTNTYNMTMSPSLDVSLFPVYDGNTADKIVSPGISVSQTFAGGFAGLTDVDEVHSVVGAYSSGSTSTAVFGSVFGISTTADNYDSPGALGAGMNVSINGASTGPFGGGRAPAIVELYGDLVKLRHIDNYLVGGGSNIAHSGTDLADYRTVLRYSSGIAQGTGGIQPGTIAWTTSAVTGVTLTGGVAGDLVFKYTV